MQISVRVHMLDRVGKESPKLFDDLATLLINYLLTFKATISAE